MSCMKKEDMVAVSQASGLINMVFSSLIRTGISSDIPEHG